MSLSTPARLRKLITNYYSRDELRTLCFDLGVRYDELPGDSLSGQVRELLLLSARRGRLGDLVQLVVAERPFLLEQAGFTDEAELVRTLYLALPKE
jgi:hypothetical protein